MLEGDAELRRGHRQLDQAKKRIRHTGLTQLTFEVLYTLDGYWLAGLELDVKPETSGGDVLVTSSA